MLKNNDLHFIDFLPLRWSAPYGQPCGTDGYLQHICRKYRERQHLVYGVARRRKHIVHPLKKWRDTQNLTTLIWHNAGSGCIIKSPNFQSSSVSKKFISHGFFPEIFKAAGKGKPFTSIRRQMYGRSNSLILCPQKVCSRVMQNLFTSTAKSSKIWLSSSLVNDFTRKCNSLPFK